MVHAVKQCANPTCEPRGNRCKGERNELSGYTLRVARNPYCGLLGESRCSRRQPRETNSPSDPAPLHHDRHVACPRSCSGLSMPRTLDGIMTIRALIGPNGAGKRPCSISRTVNTQNAGGWLGSGNFATRVEKRIVSPIMNRDAHLLFQRHPRVRSWGQSGPVLLMHRNGPLAVFLTRPVASL